MILILEDRINNKNFKYEINVYGGDDYSKGKIEHDPPHFHLTYDILDITIKIPTVDNWDSDKNKR